MLTSLTGRIGSRWRAVLTALVVAALVVGGVVAYVQVGDRGTRALCAQLPDSAGLYPGNAVNIRGVKVGAVTDISPHPGHVTVQMKIDDRPIAAGVRVVAVNNSVLADRRLELVGAQERGGPVLTAGECVPLTAGFTPISVSTAFQTFTEAFDRIGGPTSDSEQPIGQALSEISRQFDGTGDDLNAIIKNVAGFMSDPDDFLAQMRTVFDNLAVLTDVAGDNWEAITDIGKNAADLTHLMGSLFKSFVYIFDGLGESGPGLDDLLSNVVPPLLDMTNDFKPLIEVGLDRVDDLTAMLKELPGIAHAVQASLNRKTGGFTVSVRTPAVRAQTPDSKALCGLMNRVDPGSCDPASPRAAEVDLGALIAAAVQGGVQP